MMRAIIFPEDGAWTAQLLEHDISTDAPTSNDAVNRLADTIDTERRYYAELGRDLDSIRAAPAKFQRMWEEAGGKIHAENEFFWRLA